MTAYIGGDKIKDTDEHGVYIGSKNTNCLIETPKNIDLDFSPLNAQIYNNLTVNNGVASGFSAENVFGILNDAGFNTTGKDWEIVVCFTLTSIPTTSNILISPNSEKPYGNILLGVTSSGFGWHLGSNNSSWNITTGSVSVTWSANKPYWVKMTYSYSAQKYKLELSTNGTEYSILKEVSSTLQVYQGQSFRFGKERYNNQNPFKQGSIDISQSYIKIGNELWWKGGTGALTLKAGSKVYIPNGFDSIKYYKYTYEAWIQPVLSANGTLGGDSFACLQSNTYQSDLAFKAFDNSTSTAWTNNGNTGSLTFYNPVRLLVTNFQITNGANASYVRAIRSGTVYGSDNNIDWESIKTFTNAVYTASGVWNIDLSTNTKGYKYYKLDVVGDGSYAIIANLKITATQQTSVESTADDYDYTVGDGSMKFDEVVIESDIVASNYTGYTFTALACYVPELNKVILNDIYTGSGNGFEYNTEENYLRLAGTWTDTTWTGKKTALPLGLIEMTSAVGATSIIQIFDWCGYIGSTAFVLPKVKGLISNGFNADGTYKSIELVYNNVMITTASSTTGERVILGRAEQIESGAGWIEVDNEISGTAYAESNPWIRVLCKDTNKVKVYTATDLIDYYGIQLGTYTTGGTQNITSLTPYTAQPAMTCIPVKEIYNGSQLVYQYQKVAPGTVLLYAANTGTRTFTLEKGVYQVALCGARGKDVTTVAGGYAWGNAGSGGGFVEVVFYIPEKTTVTLYSTSQGNGASYMNFGSTRMITANGGADGAGAAGTCSVSSSLDVVQTIKNVTGNKGGTGLASTPSVATVSTYGNWGSTANSSGGVRLEYIRLNR